MEQEQQLDEAMVKLASRESMAKKGVQGVKAADAIAALNKANENKKKTEKISLKDFMKGYRKESVDLEEGRYDASNDDREMRIGADHPEGGGAPIKNKGWEVHHFNAEGSHVRTHSMGGALDAAKKAHELAKNSGHSAKIFSNGVHVSTVKHDGAIPHHYPNI